MGAPERTGFRLLSRSAEATEGGGGALGRLLLPDSVVALDGDLGAGKTTFVRGLARGLGLEEGVSSPTYVLMQAHEGGRLPLYHFDAWMEGREKALFLDGGDHWLRAGGVAVVEWAERVEPWLPSEGLLLRFSTAFLHYLSSRRPWSMHQLVEQLTCASRSVQHQPSGTV